MHPRLNESGEQREIAKLNRSREILEEELAQYKNSFEVTSRKLDESKASYDALLKSLVAYHNAMQRIANVLGSKAALEGCAWEVAEATRIADEVIEARREKHMKERCWKCGQWPAHLDTCPYSYKTEEDNG